MAVLVWKGKRRRGRTNRVRRPPVALRTDEVYGGDGPQAWQNRLILGDAAKVLPGLVADFAEEVSLVYVDPPFETGGEFQFLATLPGATGAPRIAVPAYRDARGLDAWLSWFFEMAGLLRTLLVEGGSLYVHLDTHVVHYAKVILDEVFGPGAFQREIIWRIGWVSGFKSRAQNWIRNHDVILFYVKRPTKKRAAPLAFHKEYVPYPPGYARRDGAPPTGPGYPMEDVWNASELDRLDSIQIKSFSREKVGYPTQKNESLVARIVRASSSPGDLVLDCFVGSGTTAVVAEKLGRRWIGVDVSAVAIHAARKRLLGLGATHPFVVESTPLARSDFAPHRRKLSTRLAVEGATATVELASFVMPARAVSAQARVAIDHWSQWVDGWCVDWDHGGSHLSAGSRLWRGGGANGALPLAATHRYARPGRHAVLVKVFDVLGGATTVELRVDVAD